jgi:hypothetical protein
MRATTEAALAQNDKTSEMRRAAKARELERTQLKILAEQAAHGEWKPFLNQITDNFRWGKGEAIERDPIVGPLVKEHPELIPLISKDERSSPELFAAMRSLKLDYGIQAYVRSFADTLMGLEKP